MKKKLICAVVVAAMMCVFIASATATEKKKIQVVGKDGQTVLVNDIFKRENSKVAMTFINTVAKYSIDFRPQKQLSNDKITGEFTIGVFGRTLKEMRTNQSRAENYLIKILGVDRKTACNLPLSFWYSPKNLKDATLDLDLFDLNTFSFCPGGRLTQRVKK